MKKRRLSIQKIFWAISIGFILSCFIFYGYRFIKLYLENKEVETETDNFARLIKKNNFGKDNFKNISGSYYFYGDTDNNYVLYSNILWRIVRVNGDNSVMLISNDSLLNLAFGKDISDYQDSYIYSWLNDLNEDYTGILENLLNDKEKYLVKTKTCVDKLDDISSKCESYLTDNYVNLLSVYDYVNAGSSESFINNNTNMYLATLNNNNKVWYINSSNKLALGDGTNLYSIRPVIYLNSNLNLIDGDGSIDEPYIIEKSNGLFGSYVKLDDDIWRVYDIDEDNVKLVLNNYIKVNGDNLQYAYSSSGTYFNDTKTGTLAYYLNKTYLNSLSYKDLAQTCYYSNGYYGEDNDYNYKDVLDSTIDSKITIQSIGNIILNSELSNYFLMTGTSKNGSLLYTINNNSMYGKNSSNKLYVVPTICINKGLLTSGKGTENEPYEVTE